MHGGALLAETPSSAGGTEGVGTLLVGRRGLILGGRGLSRVGGACGLSPPPGARGAARRGGVPHPGAVQLGAARLGTALLGSARLGSAGMELGTALVLAVLLCTAPGKPSETGGPGEEPSSAAQPAGDAGEWGAGMCGARGEAAGSALPPRHPSWPAEDWGSLPVLPAGDARAGGGGVGAARRGQRLRARGFCFGGNGVQRERGEGKRPWVRGSFSS